MFCRYRAMKKNIASIANDTTKATRLVPRNERERKNEKSTIGLRTRSSMATNATSAKAASANRPTIRPEPQPQRLDSTSPRTRPVSPMVSVATPGTSMRRATVSSRDSCAANSVTATAPAATGRLRKKIARQLTDSVSSPPRTGPMASASADTPAQVPIALPRSCGGKALVMIDSVAGIISAAPMPWIARPATSALSVGASPMAALESANTTTPTRKARRRPKMSPRRPPVTSSTAKLSV